MLASGTQIIQDVKSATTILEAAFLEQQAIANGWLLRLDAPADAQNLQILMVSMIKQVVTQVKL